MLHVVNDNIYLLRNLFLKLKYITKVTNKTIFVSKEMSI